MSNMTTSMTRASSAPVLDSCSSAASADRPLAASMTSVKADGAPVPRPRVDRMQLGLHPLYRLYQTADGWVCIAATKDGHWRGLLEAFGRTGVGDDPHVQRLRVHRPVHRGRTQQSETCGLHI